MRYSLGSKHTDNTYVRPVNGTSVWLVRAPKYSTRARLGLQALRHHVLLRFSFYFIFQVQYQAWYTMPAALGIHIRTYIHTSIYMFAYIFYIQAYTSVCRLCIYVYMYVYVYYTYTYIYIYICICILKLL